MKCVSTVRGWVGLVVVVSIFGCEIPSQGDSGEPDELVSDAGTSPDSGVADAGREDAGSVTEDAGVVDAGEPPDASVELDAGALDAGELDAGDPDAGPLDAGTFSLKFSPGDLVPAFDPAITDYELTEYSTLTPMTVTVSGSSSATLGSVMLVDGQPTPLNAQPITAANSAIVVTVGATQYTIHLKPADWPSFTVTSRDPQPGKIFLSPFSFTATPYGHFLMVLNAEGDVLFYRRITGSGLDFKPHLLPGNVVRYSYWMGGEVYVLDENFRPLRSFRNLATATHLAVLADNHDFILLSDDHYVLMGNYNEYVTNVPASLSPAVGGAFVTATTIQEVNAGQVIFEWDSVDHPELYELSTDGNNFSSADAQDYTHVNSIVIDPQDDHFVLSFRHLDAVLKLDRRTGAIVWRLGGPNDSFSTPPSQRSSHQHFAEVIDRDTIQIFDNGNAVGASRVATYHLDPDAGTLQSFEEFSLGGSFAFAMGSAQRRGDTLFVGLGANGPGTPDALEFSLDGGAESFRLQFDDDLVYSYRVLKF